MTARKHSVADDDHLLALGHAAELSRNFSFLSMLGLAFASQYLAPISFALPVRFL